MNIIITGVSRGIGKELVLLFATDIKNNIVVFSHNVSKAKELQKYCLAHFNNSIKLVEIDFLSEDIENQLEDIFNELSLSFDIVINNAGYLINQPFLASTQIDIDQLFKINFYAPLFICKNIISSFSNADCHIVNIGSMGGVQGSVKFSSLSIYSASKAALANLTECLAEEMKDDKISINCLALGSAQTEMLQEAFPCYQSSVSATEMAKFIHHFSKTGNKLFNGKIIPVAVTTP